MMTQSIPETVQRSYGCTYGCGNPYDYLIVSVADGTTEFLCLPCFVRLATDLVAAMTSPDGEVVLAAVRDMGHLEQVPMSAPGPKSRGRNAPATNDDDDVLTAFDGIITEDDLPEDFR